MIRKLFPSIVLGFLIPFLFSCGKAGDNAKDNDANLDNDKKHLAMVNAEGIWAVTRQHKGYACDTAASKQIPGFLDQIQTSLTLNQVESQISITDEVGIFVGEAKIDEIAWSGQVFDEVLEKWITLLFKSDEIDETTFHGDLRWQIRASIDGDVECFGTVALFASKIDNQTPAAPSHLRGQALSSNALKLEWNDNSTSEIAFSIELLDPLDGIASGIKIVESNNTQTILQGFLPETEYRLQVRAYNNIGKSSATEAVLITTKPVASQLPVAPIDFSISQVESGLRFQWQDQSDNETQFRIYRGIDADDPASFDSKPLLAQVNSTDLTHHLKLKFDTQYHFAIRSFNSVGESDLVIASFTSAPMPASVPLAASDLTAEAVAEDTVKLYWKDNASDESDYIIERSASSSTIGFEKIANLGANSRAYLNQELQALKTYFYRIVATNSVGDAEPSDVVAVTTKEAPQAIPSAPSTLVASNLDSGHVLLTWENLADNNQKYFVLQRSLSGKDNYLSIAKPLSGSLSYVDKNINPLVEYEYRLAASNRLGDSIYIYSNTVLTLPDVPPAPGNVSASINSTSTITIRWNDYTVYETEYRIERRLVAGDYELLAVLPADTTQFVDNNNGNGYVPNTQFYYRVRAVNQQGASPYSDEVLGFTIKQAPSVPTNIRVTNIRQLSASINWDHEVLDVAKSADEFVVTIRRFVGDVFIVDSSVTLDGGKRQLLLTELSANTLYQVEVLAKNSGGEAGEFVVFSTLETVPDTPMITSISAPSEQQGVLQIGWSDVSNESAYLIYRAENQLGMFDVLLDTVDANVTSYIDNTGLNVYSRYYYRISASNSGGESAQSNTVNHLTNKAAPQAPALASAIEQSDTEILVSWSYTASNQTSSADQFTIQRSASIDCCFSSITSVDADVSSFTDTQLDPFTTYYYRVLSSNSGGASVDFSPVVSATTLKGVPSQPSFAISFPLIDPGLAMLWSDNSTELNSTDSFVLQRADISRINGGTYNYTLLGDNIAATTLRYDDVSATGQCRFYRYQIKAVNTMGESAWATMTRSTPPSALATAPVLNTVSAVAVGTTSANITIDWSDQSNNESGFSVYAELLPTQFGVRPAIVGEVSANLQSFTYNVTATQAQTWINQGFTSIRYYVTANNGCGRTPSNKVGDSFANLF